MSPYIPQNLPISKIDWERHIPLIGKVNRSLAYYDGILHGIANPALLLSPLTTQEAVLSSKIEGTQATLGDVLKFEAGEQPAKEERKLDIQEITNYRHALFTAEKMLKTKPFHLNFMRELHAIILDSVRGSNKSPGEFRRTQNWIGKPGTPIEQAEYIPPSPDVMMKSLSDWEKYYHADPPDSVVQLAVLHAQFELIHPFLDGNGRVGRMIIPLFLFEKKILRRPMFYLSKYLEAHRDEYVSRLKALSGEFPKWNEWIEFFLRGVDEQAKENAYTVQRILALYDALKERCIELTRSQFAVPLLDQIFKKPIFQSSHLFGAKNLPSKAMTLTLLSKLRKAGILKVLSEGSGRRAQVMVLPELINITEGRKIF